MWAVLSEVEPTVMKVFLHVPWAMMAMCGMMYLVNVRSNPVFWWMMLLYLRFMFGRQFGILISIISGIVRVLYTCMKWVVPLVSVELR